MTDTPSRRTLLAALALLTGGTIVGSVLVSEEDWRQLVGMIGGEGLNDVLDGIPNPIETDEKATIPAGEVVSTYDSLTINGELVLNGELEL